MTAIQQQPRGASPFMSVSSADFESISAKQTISVVHAGFMLGSPLPAPHRPGYNAGFVAGFVAYRATVTTEVSISIRARYRFSVSSQARPQVKDDVRDLFERALKHPPSAMLFEHATTYRVTTTVSVLYFGYVCWQGQTPAPSRGVPPAPASAPTPKQVAASNAHLVPAAPSFEPAPEASSLPAAAPVPAPAAPVRPSATVSLKPVEASKKSDPSNWKDLQDFTPKKARFELWDMEKRDKWLPVQLSLADSPTKRNVTPQELAPDGLSFIAKNEDKLESIPLDKVKTFSVLNNE